MKSRTYTHACLSGAQQDATWGVLRSRSKSKGSRMQMKKLFKILVVGGSALAVLAGAGCGGGSNSSNNNQLNTDGGTDGGGVHGW